MKPSGCCCRSRATNSRRFGSPALAHLADQQIQLVAALRRQPGPADLGEAPPQIRRAARSRPSSTTVTPASRARLIRLRSFIRFVPANEKRGSSSAKVDPNASTRNPRLRNSVHVAGAHLQRHHLLAVARGVAQEGVQQIGAAVLGRVHAAGHQPVPALAPEGNEPLQSGTVKRRLRDDSARKPDG